ncbi:MAG: DUF2202 domain-containing protein [Methanosarcinales archaeon]|nr:DUF2202 domain-containing protein [Methanosarcinales archaeon]
MYIRFALLLTLAIAFLSPPGPAQPFPAIWALSPQSDNVSDQAFSNFTSVDNASSPAAEESVLSPEEQDGLLYMREEEKLARDLYLAFYSRFKLPIFNNIADSEQVHMDSVKGLLDRYGLEDPARDQRGSFANSHLQTLYNNLSEMGNQSAQEALMAGAAVEEIDILDLESRLQDTSREDIIAVYENLLRGSRNHLRAFVMALKQEGLTYSPRYLSQSQYDRIVRTSRERGRP